MLVLLSGRSVASATSLIREVENDNEKSNAEAVFGGSPIIIGVGTVLYAGGIEQNNYTKIQEIFVNFFKIKYIYD